jgi:hypothetical protein
MPHHISSAGTKSHLDLKKLTNDLEQKSKFLGRAIKQKRHAITEKGENFLISGSHRNKYTLRQVANIYQKIANSSSSVQELEKATKAFKNITHNCEKKLYHHFRKSHGFEKKAVQLNNAEKMIQSGEKRIQRMKDVKAFCSDENKQLLRDFQAGENEYMIRQKKLQDTPDKANWITVAASKEHVQTSFDYLEKRIQRPEDKQIPIVLGGLELRNALAVDDVEDDAGRLTAGIVSNFGSLHQSGKLEPREEDKDLAARVAHKGYGGVLESSEWSLGFNLIGTLTPSVFSGEPLVYGRESDNAAGVADYQRSLNSEGKMTLTAIRETDPNLDEAFKHLPNVKAKELMFLLKTGFKPHWESVGSDEKHRQLSFIPPSPEEFNKNFPLALKSLEEFRETKIDGNGPFEQLLREHGLLA